VVSFPTIPSLSKQPGTIQVHQSMNKHDVIVLNYRTVSRQVTKLLKTGVPFTLKWTQAKRTRTIYCYVSHVSSETKGGRFAEMEIVATGGSYPLKKRSTAVYKKKTIPEAAAVLAKTHRLKASITPHKHRYDQLNITGHSDWAWLREQARKIGYGLMVDGLTLVYKPLDKLLDQSTADSPIMSMFNVPQPANLLLYDRTLDYFKMLSGENIEDAKYKRSIKKIGGVNPLTGKAFVSKADPRKVGKNLRKKASDVLFDEYLTNYVVTNASAAQMTATGAAHLARLNIPAMVKGQGDPRMKPFSPVMITGVSEEADGWWVINSVIHKFRHTGEYEVEMIVSTDGLGESSQTRPSPVASTNSSSSPIPVTTNGKIDIEAALANKNRPLGVRLTNKGGFYQEGNQGFNRTPRLWQSDNIGPRKVC
jgi:phage protein D